MGGRMPTGLRLSTVQATKTSDGTLFDHPQDAIDHQIQLDNQMKTTALKTAFIVVSAFAASVLIWRDGYDRGLIAKTKDIKTNCVLQKGETLVSTTQFEDGVLCNFFPHSTYGRAVYTRRAQL